MIRWTLSKEFRFEASHQLPHHKGKCARLHGHSWVGRVFVSSAHLIQEGPETGMVVDYSRISTPIKDVVERELDHHHLNDLLKNPTSEEVARWLFDYLEPWYASHKVQLDAVEIEETCTCRCRYGRTA